jgi:ADP-ribose pyrophosphatase YjhB (NUDIX family)
MEKILKNREIKKIGVSCIITEKTFTKFIMQRKDKQYPVPQFVNCITFFGGGVEYGEAPEVAIKREIKEEILLDELQKIIISQLQYFGTIYTKFKHQVYCYYVLLDDFIYFEKIILQYKQKSMLDKLCSEGVIETLTSNSLENETFAWNTDKVLELYRKNSRNI